MARNRAEEDCYPVNLRMDKTTLEELEHKWRDQQFRSRTAYLLEAITSYMHGVSCPYCGAMNPCGGRICSVCLRPLSADEPTKVMISIEGKDIKVEPITPDKIAEKKGWKN